MGKSESVGYKTPWVRSKIDERYPDGYNWRLVKNQQDLKDLFNELKEAKVVAIDTETTDKDWGYGHIVGMCFATTEDSGWYMPIRHEEYKHNIPPAIFPKLYQLLKDKVILMYNACFDMQMLNKEVGWDCFKMKIIDVMGICYLIDTNIHLPSLKDMELHFLGRKAPTFEETLKGRPHFGFIPPEEALIYTATDAASTFGLWKKLYPIVHKEAPKALKLDTSFVPILLKLNHTKLWLRAELLPDLIQYYEKSMKEQEEYIFKELGYPFNLRSNKQLEVAFKQKGIDTGYKTEKGSMSLKAEVLDLIAYKYPFVKSINKYKSMSSTLSNLKKFKGKDYIRCNYEMYNTVCLTEESHVLIKDKGLISVKDVKENDLIYTVYGWKKVTWHHPHFREDKLIQVKLSNGRTLTGTEEHPVRLLNNEWYQLRDLKINDKLRYHNTIINFEELSQYLQETETRISYYQSNSDTFKGELALQIQNECFAVGEYYDIVDGILDFKHKSPQDENGIYYTEIIDIQPVKNKWVYDIEVEDVHEYVADGLVQHNTGRMSSGSSKEVKNLPKGVRPWFDPFNAQNFLKSKEIYYKGIYKPDDKYSILGYRFEPIDKDKIQPDDLVVEAMDYRGNPRRLVGALIRNEKGEVVGDASTHYYLKCDYSSAELLLSCMDFWESVIPTSNGIKKISELNPKKDLLIGKGNQLLNFRLTTQDSDDMYHVEWSNGAIESYDGNHKLWTFNSKTLSKELTKIRDITPEHQVIAYLGIPDWKPEKASIPLYDNEGQPIFLNNNIVPYICGLYLGDGYVNNGVNSVSIVIWKEYTDYILEELKKVGLKATIHTNRSKKIWIVSIIGSKEFSKFVVEHFGRIGDEKHISPEIYQYWNKEQLKYFFAGLIDSDGSYDKNLICFNNSNKQLISDIAILCNCLGIIPRNYYKGISGMSKKPMYRIVLSDVLDKNIPIMKEHRRPKANNTCIHWEVDGKLLKNLYSGRGVRNPNLRKRLNNMAAGKGQLTRSTIDMLKETYPTFNLIDNTYYPIHMVCKERYSGTKAVIEVESDTHLYKTGTTISHNCNFSKEPVLMNAFLKGIDPHTNTAKAMFGVTDKAHRAKAKSCNFSLLYEGSPDSLCRNSGLEYKEAEALWLKYWQTMTTLKSWKVKEQQKANMTGKCATYLGRPRRLSWYFRHPKNSMRNFAKRSVISHEIQGTLGDVIKTTIIKAYKAIFDKPEWTETYDVAMGLIVHDEIGAFVRKERMNEYLDTLLKLGKTQFSTWKLPLQLSVDVGTSYGFVLGAVQDENGNWQVKFKKGSDIIGK